jgi:hypothetical protein
MKGSWGDAFGAIRRTQLLVVLELKSMPLREAIVNIHLHIME